MFVSAIGLAIGSYFLLTSNFRTLINYEAQSALNMGDTAYYSLMNEIREDAQMVGDAKSEHLAIKEIAQIAKSISISRISERVSFCIIEKNGVPAFSSLEQSFDKSLISEMGKNQRGWTLKSYESRSYIQAIRPAVFLGNFCYIETIRDVSFIFENQQRQLTLLFRLMIGMLAFTGVLSAVISKLIMRPVISLSKATKIISTGNLDQRVPIKGNDELSLLSQSFNSMADELERKFEELKAEAERREMFVGAFSHELKTPLTSIIGYSDMLRSKKMDEDRIRVCADYIFTEGKRLEKLSMRLLELIVLNNQEVCLTPVSIKPLLDEVCTVVEPQLMAANITIKMDIEPSVIQMEPELMKTVLINFIDNSRKAMDGGGTIRVSGTRCHDVYNLKISDSGKGMEEQELSKIKDAFYMVDKSRSRKQGGAGLGLAICDRIIKMHGFEATFESAAGVGTTVTMLLKGAEDEKE